MFKSVAAGNTAIVNCQLSIINSMIERSLIYMSIAENVARIRAELNAAAISCGRDPKEIQLCAATKMNDADAVRRCRLLR